jgi:hypothetical protein
MKRGNYLRISSSQHGILPNSNENQAERKRDFNKRAREHISTRDAERDFPLRYFRRYFFVDLGSNSDARYRSINIFVRRYFPPPARPRADDRSL